MIKTVGIVSLSSGILGEPFISHELEIGINRLQAMGLNVRFLPHALKGMEYIAAHPEDRAADLLQAFMDPEIDMILCAIGGDDTYRLLPYLMEDDRLRRAIKDKVFLGFSDTTINHFTLHKIGLNTFYGQSFLADICELGNDMLPYSRRYFEELIITERIQKVMPSDLWYEERKAFTADQIGVPLTQHKDSGFELLQGNAVFSGKILGGCIDSIYDMFACKQYADMPPLCQRYHIFPAAEEWRGHILLLESSEEKMPPEQYEKTLQILKQQGVFNAVNGVLVGKPMDNIYHEEYKKLLVSVIDNPDLPIVCNLNIGHAQPRCILPLGVEATVDANQQKITFHYT